MPARIGARAPWPISSALVPGLFSAFTSGLITDELWWAARLPVAAAGQGGERRLVWPWPPRLRGQPASVGTPPAGQAGRLVGGRQPLPAALHIQRPRPAPPPRPRPGWAGWVPSARCWDHRSLLHLLGLQPRDALRAPEWGAGLEGLALLQTRGPGEAEAGRELSQLQAPRATGTRPVTQVPRVHGIFSQTSTARASWRTLTRATGRWGHALSLGRVTHAEAPAVRPGTGAPSSARSQLSPWGQPGWGGGPAWPHALLAHLIPALGAVMSRRPGAWRGLDSHLQPPGPGPCVLFPASTVRTCGFSQQDRITLDRGGEGLGTGSRWWARPGSRSCGLRTRSWTGLGGPLPESPQPR